MNELNQYINGNQQRFQQFFAKSAQITASAPGRINLIGEHTDYNGGLSVPAAINRWVIVSGSKRNDQKIHIYSENYQESLVFELNQDFSPQSMWQKYVYGVISLFSRDYKLTEGFEAIIWGNIPIGSGVSSSAGIEVSFANFLRGLFQIQISDLALVKLCQQVEHQFLGLKSGLLDQYASQFSQANQVMVLDFQNLTHQYVAADFQDFSWVLVNSGVKRELAGSKYTERVNETLEALDILQMQFPEIQHFRDIKSAHLEFIDQTVIRKRITHFVEENARVRQFVHFLAEKDWVNLGKMLYASHYSLKNDYEISCPEIDFLVECAESKAYVLGARIMGGGFGGCTIQLIKKDYIADFQSFIIKEYQTRFHLDAQFEQYDLVGGANHVLVQS
jgi:galactokinase